ncbi:hypothetical protein O6H91_10G040600 [Diphasiastrum complanatum]|uniref:Uncharacterized protein n=1 Tax=Diphasiastrum complanatum TaxID=34168 RepID=A0ACC2CG92_DIPCM|nr:hypothetical protein O6H91_Y377700 [Diphasiastrum complanatum]KAJ7541005.1 hypothetical protein O6H91_10G040600 [Diphasiastrum complanatum]
MHEKKKDPAATDQLNVAVDVDAHADSVPQQQHDRQADERNGKTVLNLPMNSKKGQRQGSRSRIRGRNKPVTALAPSASHPDVQPPPLDMVRRALSSGIGGGTAALTKIAERAVRRSNRTRAPSMEFRDSEGRMLLPGSGGGRYVGDVLGGAPHGFGQHWVPYYSDREHLLYEGEWVHGNKTGLGSVHYINGQEYHGELETGERCGWGCMRYKDGSVYDGEWLKGRKHGYGALYYRNGNWYEGAWCRDEREGWGSFFWPSIRRKFEGEWASNNPFTGCYFAMDAQEYNLLQRRIPWFAPACFSVMEKGAPLEQLQIVSRHSHAEQESQFKGYPETTNSWLWFSDRAS